MSGPKQFDYTAFDTLLDPKGPVMLVGQQLLKPAAFDMATDIVFPPTYANPEKKDDSVYNIDVLDPWDPSKNVCVLDSIPSQANRMEPLFGRPPHDALVPQYRVRLTQEIEPMSILQAGHRLADAVFRGTELRPRIEEAFKKYAAGDAVPIARLGPTSLVFGVWDSRGTGVKVPRLINSIIRAFNVRPLKRSAQYVPPIKYEQEGLIPAGLEGKPADYGLADVPSTHKIGGVQVDGDIRRDFSLNLELLRGLKGSSDATQKLQRYILALALLAFTARQESTLRQGCQLLPRGKARWKRFEADGREVDWNPDDFDFVGFADAAASDFVVDQPQNQPLAFTKERLKTSIDADAKKKADKKANSDNPLAVISKLVGGLKVSSSGGKLNDAPLNKLKSYLATVSDGPIKSLAASIHAVLAGDDAPQARVDRVRKLVAEARSAEPPDADTAGPDDTTTQEDPR